MEYLPVDRAAKVVELLNKKSEYIPGYGARCPLCGAWGDLKDVKKRKTEGRRRYYVCPDCFFKFAAG